MVTKTNTVKPIFTKPYHDHKTVKPTKRVPTNVVPTKEEPVILRRKYTINEMRKIIKDNKMPPKIPHIIHQTWDTHSVPAFFEKWIKTWSLYHPAYEYWFWTPNDVR